MYKLIYTALIIVLISSYCFSQEVLLNENNIEKLNKKEKREMITNDLIILNGAALENYLNFLELNKLKLNQFDSILIKKTESTNYPYDLFILSNKLLSLNGRKHKPFIEKVLLEKKSVWDVNNWSIKFWNLIKTNSFKIYPDSSHIINSTGNKSYNIESYLQNKIELNELGQNPLLFIDYELVEYDSGKLIEVLKNIEIINIEFVDKQSTVKLFGKRGIDGQLKIFTK